MCVIERLEFIGQVNWGGLHCIGKVSDCVLERISPSKKPRDCDSRLDIGSAFFFFIAMVRMGELDGPLSDVRADSGEKILLVYNDGDIFESTKTQFVRRIQDFERVYTSLWKFKYVCSSFAKVAVRSKHDDPW